ncbi:MAG TPA: PEP-CTERM sorting domain-containing protein [Anaerohalosphaeraceae bacterium]|nr:PEP-CTERM sorting domain-containing protein [Anaerohalosphaeraceae bacterium]
MVTSKQVMKKAMSWFLSILLIAGSASAEVITVTDALVNTYGNTQGLAIDFDTTTAGLNPAITEGWVPALVDGQKYYLDFIRVRSGAEVLVGSGVVYLGVYTGLGTGGALSGFLGTSTNTIDFKSTVNGEWYTFNFSGISVTADSVVGAGTGMLYFVFQPTTAAKANTYGDEIRLHRINADTTINQSLSSVIAYGGLSTLRSLEYQVQITPIPEPTTMALMGLGVFAFRRKR